MGKSQRYNPDENYGREYNPQKFRKQKKSKDKRPPRSNERENESDQVELPPGFTRKYKYE